MGAPGYYHICRQGHVYHWIDEHLYWDDSTDQQVRQAARGCPCGETAYLQVEHYGDVNDCVDTSVGQLVYQTTEHLTRRHRVASAYDAAGQPIEAYVDQTIALPRYAFVRAAGQQPTEELPGGFNLSFLS